MAATADNMPDLIYQSRLISTYADTEDGGEECKADCVRIMQDEYELNETQAQAVADFVWWDGYERGWDTEWERYVAFAADLGELAQKIIVAA